eukprot:8333469-Alexandrium_andersonii.AAC.1
MSASLVGSEMCIRDSPSPAWEVAVPARPTGQTARNLQKFRAPLFRGWRLCLLYTSDAADDM